MRFLSLQYFPQIRIDLSVRTVLVKTMPVVKLLITAVLALVAVAIGGCYIASYRPLMPEVRPIEVEKKDRKEFLSFFYFSGGTPNPRDKLTSLPEEFIALLEIFQNHSRFSKIIVASAPPAIGTHFTAYQTYRPETSLWCTASLITITAIPCYTERGGYAAQFDVYIDNVIKKSYQYNISRRWAWWIGFAPFVWLNGLTNGHTGALKAVTYQFLRDGERDGYF